MAAVIGGDGVAAAGWLDRAAAAIGSDRPTDAEGWLPVIALAGVRAAAASIPAIEMAAEAEYAYRRLRPGIDWQPMACLMWGAAQFMLGDDVRAEELLREVIACTEQRPVIRSLALAHLAVLQVERDQWDAAIATALEARTILGDDVGLPGTCLVTALSSLALARMGRADEAAADHQLSRRHLAGFNGIAPWLNLQTRIALARGSLLVGRQVEAATLLDEAEAILTAVPDAVIVTQQLAQVRRTSASGGGSIGFGPTSLTTAELRVVQYLPTHLSVGEIADRLYLSRNTVKTHTIAIYRKLGTSSRSGAVDLARAAGLID